MRFPLGAALVLSAVLPLVACGGTSSDTSTSGAGASGGSTGTGGDTSAGGTNSGGMSNGGTSSGGAASCATVARTCASVMATFASSASDVKVSCDEAAGTFTLQSTGVPQYSSNQKTPNAIEDQMWVVQFPLQPTCAASTESVVASRGPVGFMINGVPFYGPQDANGNDAIVNEGPSFDDCDGHADDSCSYHYHEEPICVFGQNDTATQHKEADGHAAVIGYAYDGFAIHAAPADGTLDGCNGHTDGARGYHYHATSASPYLVGCYAGNATGKAMRTPACTGGQPTGGGGTTGAGGGMGAGGMGLKSCSAAGDCTGACPPNSKGCTCGATPMGSLCVPTCDVDGDCPVGMMGKALHCNQGMCGP